MVSEFRYNIPPNKSATVDRCRITYLLSLFRPTGDNDGGEAIVGMGSNVDTAGALVSPLISAPSPLDFRLGLGRRSLADCEFNFDGEPFAVLVFVLEETLRCDNWGNRSRLLVVVVKDIIVSAVIVVTEGDSQ